MYVSNFIHLIKGLDPVADAFDGTVYSDVFNLSLHLHALFIIYKGVGTTGTSTITVEACDNVTPSNVSAIAFYYQAITSTDVHGAATLATTAGFATTAGSSELYLISVKAGSLAASGYGYVRLKAVEVVDDPVLGGILGILMDPKYGEAVQDTRIT